MKIKSLVTVLSLSLVVTQSHAAPQGEESKADSTLEAAEIRVTSTPIIEGNMTEPFGNQVTIVSAAQLRDLEAGDLPSALRRTPGVVISRYNLVGSYGGREGGAVYIRGMGASRPGSEIQVMVDGVPRFVGVWTHPLMDMVSIDPAAQIEIHKSPEPLSFGNMSFAALNVLTKSAPRPGPSMNLHLGGGSFKTYFERLALAYGSTSERKYDLYFSESLRRSDGHREGSAGRLSDIFGKVRYSFSPGLRLSASYDHTDNWADDPGAEGSPRPEVARFAVRTDTYNLTLERTGAGTRGRLQAFLDRGHISWRQVDQNGPYASLTDWDNWGLRIQGSIRPVNSLRLRAGVDLDRFGGKFVERHETADEMKHPEEHFTTIAPYAGARYTARINGSTTLTPSFGLRYTMHSEMESSPAPQAGLVLKRGKLTLRAYYAKGINYAGLHARNMYGDWNAGEGWKDLSPEKTGHVELGLSWHGAARSRLDVTLFQDKGKDLIRFVPPPPPPPHFENAAEFRVRGVEATLSARPFRSTGLFAAVTLLDPDPTDTPSSPKLSLSAGLNRRLTRSCEVSVDGEYYSEQYVYNPRFPKTDAKIAAFTLLNARLHVKLPETAICSTAGAFVAIENILDTDYEYRPGYPMPGRTILGGIDVGH